MTTHRLSIAILALLMLAPAGQGWAQAPERAGDLAGARSDSASQSSRSSESGRPWYRGVSRERQVRAEKLLVEAADLAEELLLGPALAKYREALETWDHPVIRYELAAVLNNAARHLEAWTELQALRASWGLDALEPADRKKAEAMAEMLLREHLAELEVRCDIAGARVELNGEPLFTGPGVERRVLATGANVVSARRDGYFPVIESVALVAGQRRTATLTMNQDRILEERHFASWKPWAAAGAGAALLLAGTGLRWLAGRDFSRADKEFVTACQDEPTCTPNLPGPYGRAKWENRLAAGTLVAGAVALVGGVALVIINRPRSRRTENHSDVQLDLVPILDPQQVGLSLSHRF